MKKRSAIAGNTFITTMVVITVLVAFIAGALLYTQQLGRLSKRTRDAQIAMEIGDGCLENRLRHGRSRLGEGPGCTVPLAVPAWVRQATFTNAT